MLLTVEENITQAGHSADSTVDSLQVRRARVADLPDVERLLTASGLPVEGVAGAMSDFVVAESGGTLVGVAGLERCGEYGLLRSVAVSHAWRSRGLGKALVTRAIAEADARGIRALYLLTTTAERYFPAFGFARVHRAEVPAVVQQTVEFTGACPASATVMRRERPRIPLDS